MLCNGSTGCTDTGHDDRFRTKAYRFQLITIGSKCIGSYNVGTAFKIVEMNSLNKCGLLQIETFGNAPDLAQPLQLGAHGAVKVKALPCKPF